MPHDHLSPASWGPVEWAAFSLCAAVTAWVIWRAVRLSFRPGEEEPDHVKRSILREDDPADAVPPAGGRT